MIINENHPFSRFPMYSSFPNWSYSFFFTDSNNRFIPSQKFHVSGGELSHLFYSICESVQIQYGDGMESSRALKQVGNEMIKLLDARGAFKAHNKRNIKIYRLYFLYNNDSIQKKYFLMYDCK